ncbi:MAG TPA: 6,7-dimethyl-8-ribityllumazine synthase [Chitinophagaceae bacterium]|nr:6,7-dimethyl-8-ribityllumazine synthase [Chitinophagaceae bacterium]
MSSSPSSLNAFVGASQPADARIVIVHSLWHEQIVHRLLTSCKKALLDQGIVPLETIAVPGAFELTFACRRYLETRGMGREAPEALIALGCVIRGGTPHFEYICQSVVQGLTSLNLSGQVPVIFGVLTADHEQQALDRSGGPQGDKGLEAALTALRMVTLSRSWLG